MVNHSDSLGECNRAAEQDRGPGNGCGLPAPDPARVEVEGGLPNNIPPSTRQFVGEDTIHLGLGVDWGEAFGGLAEKFDKCKEAAASDDADHRQGAYLLVGDTRVAFEASGAKAADGGPFYRWQFVFGGVRVLLVNRKSPVSGNANLRVQVGSQALLVLGGVESALAQVQRVVEGLGGSVLWDKLSRVDPFVDLEGVHVSEFVNRIHADQFITRARSRGIYADIAIYSNHRESTGLTFGKGPQLRIYDKVRELQRDPVKLACWINQEWGGEAPAVCTRIEFELGREFLGERDIDTVADWVKKRRAVLAYLAGEWFRFTAEAVDRANCNYGRAVDAPWWARVRDAFASRWPTGEAAKRRFSHNLIDVDRAAKQVRGLLESVAVYRGLHILNTEHLGEMAKALLLKETSVKGEEDWIATQKRIEAKRRRFDARYSVAAAPVEN